MLQPHVAKRWEWKKKNHHFQALEITSTLKRDSLQFQFLSLIWLLCSLTNSELSSFKNIQFWAELKVQT